MVDHFEFSGRTPDGSGAFSTDDLREHTRKSGGLPKEHIAFKAMVDAGLIDPEYTPIGTVQERSSITDFQTGGPGSDDLIFREDGIA